MSEHLNAFDVSSYKGRKIVVGPIYKGFGFCITSNNGCEYRERSFDSRPEALQKAKHLIDAEEILGRESRPTRDKSSR